MKKRNYCLLAFLALSIFLLMFLTVSSDKGVNYNDLRCSDAEYDSLKQNRQEVQLETEIRFEDYPLFFDANDNTYYYSLIAKSSRSYDPKVTVDNYEIAFEDKAISADQICNNEQISFIVFNETEYSEFKLSCTTLPLMNIDIYDSNHFSNYDKKISVTVFDNGLDVTDRQIRSQGVARLRGHMTKSFEKKGLRITLLKDDWSAENKRNLLGLRKDGDWILYAAYNDQDRVRNVFSERLWEEACSSHNDSQVQTSTRYEYLELFVNGNYYGLYALCHPIDQKTLNLKEGDSQYALIDWQKESDISYDNYEDISSNMTIRYGDDYDNLFDCYALINEAYENNDLETLKKLIDQKNMIDAYIFDNLIQGYDNAIDVYIKNMMIVCKRVDGGRKMLYVPWDFDLTWGNIFDSNSKNMTKNYSDTYEYNVFHMTSPINYLILNNNHDTNVRLIFRYRYLRNNEWSDENINRLIDEYEARLFGSGAYYRDVSRWPESSHYDEVSDLSIFRQYVLNRFHYLDAMYS